MLNTNRFKVRMRWAATVSCIAALAFGFSTTTASAAAISDEPSSIAVAPNPNPIDWGVITTFYGRMGDVPLRTGQHDAGPIDGFGDRHIKDGHGAVPARDRIQSTLDSGECSDIGGQKTRCAKWISFPRIQLIVVFTDRIDSRSNDWRPVGIITAYEVGQCCTAATQEAKTAVLDAG